MNKCLWHLIVYDGGRAIQNNNKKNPTKELKKAMRTHSSAFTSTWIFSFFINLLMLTGPLFMLQIYDRVLTSRSMPTLVALFLLVTFLFIVLGLLEMVRSRVFVRIGMKLDQQMSNRLFDAEILVNLKTGGGSVGGVRELDVFRQFLTGPGPFALFDSPWVPAYIALIFIFHWTLGILAVVGAIALFIIALLNDIRTRKPLDEAGKSMGASAQMADSGRRNAQVLSAMGMLTPFRNMWQSERIKGLTLQAKASDRAGTLTSISKSLRLFLQSAMLAVGAALAVKQIITPGTMIAASIILGRALQPVEQSIGQWRGFIKARQAYKAINDILEQIAQPIDRTILAEPKGHLKVNKLRAKVFNEKIVIIGRNPKGNGISFDLKPGQSLGVIGPSGSGKTTLAKALLGLWPQADVSGEVLLDNVALNKWNPEQLGRNIGYLPQGVELFGGTIKQNISRFHADPDDSAIVEAARLAGVDNMITDMPEAYETDIGFMGSKLSTGQRQRVALARALYGNPTLIVLDEPNSALDAVGQNALKNALLEMKNRGKTVVVISHRDDALQDMELMMFLTAGEQMLFGPRNEVLAKLRHEGSNKPSNGSTIRERQKERKKQREANRNTIKIHSLNNKNDGEK